MVPHAHEGVRQQLNQLNIDGQVQRLIQRQCWHGECHMWWSTGMCCFMVPSSPRGLLPCSGAGSRSLELPRMTGAATPIPASHWRPLSSAGSEWGGVLQGFQQGLY